ncbi:LacI family DNA-binding transcriptional regulator [Bacillus taeanensis]|uniref:LacI family transcriptional regulator n=1 Tax=Bacillus taeanensis TaxID=273032 RepID=A0A366XS09_9BACI|nr:LacI family DNA-binding transcriptional regulator [Bacillus taeanensis]RBW67549.1 LacI family transcriptional regulator [Bacillus taeanensis]
MSKKTTIRDVAKYADVSPATVSYVLNGVKKVSEETKLRVLQAIGELNYYPDFTAISLSKRKSNLIGIVFSLIDNSFAEVMRENPYYNEMISGIEIVARKKNFDILITGIGNIEEYRSWVKKRNLDGLLFLGLFPPKLYNEMKKIDIPIVLIDTYEEYTNVYKNVNINDELGGYLATKHLVDLGHRNIAFVATNIKVSLVDERRFQGYKRALNEAKIPFNNNLFFETLLNFEGAITFESGYKIGEQILESRENITAIVTISDIYAIGIINALQKHGKRVPEDYSVVGFDDISMCNYILPSLTTVKQDIFNKGEEAAKMLIDAIEIPSSKPKSIELPVKLIVRDSTKPL